MTAERIQRLFDEYRSRLDGVERIDDPDALLAEVFSDVARQHAKTVFLKVQSEPGWTDEAASRLADQVFHDHAMLIIDVIHRHGGAIETAQSVVVATAKAYGARFAELYAAGSTGGAA